MRAIEIEISHSFDKASFSKVIAQWGQPATILSVNDTNFEGAAK